MTLQRFDDLDRAIIDLLEADGRTSNRGIARELGVSETAIRKRLKRLSESGSISYGVIVDISMTPREIFGWLTAEVHPQYLGEVFRSVSRLPECSLCARTTGQNNLVAHMYARDRKTMADTAEAIGKLPGVIDVAFRPSQRYFRHRPQLVSNPEQDAQPIIEIFSSEAGTRHLGK